MKVVLRYVYINIYGEVVMKRISMFFSFEIIERLKAARVKTGMSISEFTRRAIIRALEAEGL